MTEQGKPNKPLKTPKALAGRYQVLARLGEGAMGETWRARQTADGSAEVVIKALKLARVDDWKAVELFEREAQALRGLDIEGVPRLIEYIRDEAGEGEGGVEGGARFYIVQSLVPGQTLAAMMAQGHRFTEAEVINLGWQVAQVLARLHARRPPIIHRDIKPSNVMVRPDGECALIDFGAVTDATGRASAEEGGETVVGTFGYMPPEQLRGRATAASDLYALGATMVHMLAGRPPSSMPTKVFRLEFRPHVQASEPLLALLDRLLEPDDAERLGSAQALVEALEALARGPGPKAQATDQPLVQVARAIPDLQAVGQPGHLALFHEAPEGTPRRVAGAYTAALVKRAALWVAGGGALVAALVLGGAQLLRLDLGAAAIGVCMVAALVYFNIRQYQATRRLIAHGAKALGAVTAKTTGGDGRVEVRFTFTTRANQTMHGKATFSAAPVLLERDAPVGVLYDPDHPARCTLYPLPPAAVVEVEP
jgi:hypothetical protein